LHEESALLGGKGTTCTVKSALKAIVKKAGPMPLMQSIRGSPTLLIVTYDSKKRVPASKNNMLEFISLGA